MKFLYTLTTALFVLSFYTAASAQVFVNSIANGNNDGTSWADAYTELATALDNYNEGDEIWVAAGTYLPQQPSAWPGDPKNTFYLYQDVKLYGGFNGTETQLSQRDPAAHQTILSGDLNGDDVPGDFETNREDNATNLMFLTEDITPLTVVDGFTIANGHAAGDTLVAYDRRGGGVWSLGSPVIEQCRFEENYALTFGGGLYLREEAADQTIVANCVFDGNRCENSGGGIIVATFGAPGIVHVTNCEFIENTSGVNGGGLYNSASSSALNNCQFSGNESGNAGGGMHFANTSSAEREVTVTNCIFENNTSNHGGAFYHFSGGPGGDDFLFENCQFIGNKAVTSPNPDFFFPDGGAMGFQYSINANPTNDSIVITDCIFDGNTADRVGGGITYFNSRTTDNYFSINDCEFTDNLAANFGGGIYFVQFDNGITPIGTQFNLVNSDFENNLSNNGGAVAFNGLEGEESTYRISNCNFNDNKSMETPEDTIPTGGAILVQFSGDDFQNNHFLIEDCSLANNSSEFAGGGLFYYGPFGSDNHFEMNDCQVEGNSAPAAGGVGIIEGGTNNTALVVNSFFNQNESATSMAAAVGRDFINPGIPAAVNPYTEFINCLFTNHEDQTGSAVVMEVFGDGVEGTLTNCTFANNNATLLGTDLLDAGGQINLRNNILSSGDSPVYVSGPAGNTGTVNSLGGNLVTDATLDAWLTSTDQSNTDPLFETGTFQLSESSPAVDAGVLLGTPTATDFAGNDRLQGGCLDIGAIESPHDAGTACQLPPRRYVDQGATGTNDGSSWENAFTTLHDALEVYNTNDEIWVAAGTYLPQQPSVWTDGPKNTFYLYQDVRLYGGFDGTETMLSERDPAANVTILSGDLNGDDVDDDFETNRADNVINVLFLTADISPATIIDGFTIANGHADGDDSELYNQEGGGVWSLGSPQIKQCRFEQNYVIGFGGGLFFRGASSDESVVESCVFTRNRSVVSGGGMLIATFGGPGIISVTDCQFIENISEASGGGLFIQSSSIEMSNCQFNNNAALGAGGGMWCVNNSGSDHQTSITACTFEGNTASNGGAFWMSSEAQGNCDINLTSCDFINNQAVIGLDTFPDGGALGFFYFDNNPQNDSIIITDCNFQGNSAEFRGGGIAYFNSFGTDNLFTIENCDFSENSAIASGGGGIYFGQFNSDDAPTGTQLNLTGNNFNDNSAANGGAVLFVGNAGTDGDYLITDCDFNDNKSIETPEDTIPTGGAILVQFSGDDFQNNHFLIEDCSLANNSSEFAGGGLFYYGPFGSDNHFEMNDCQVEGNSAPAAGGVGIIEGGTNNTALVVNSFFNQNESATSMAAAVGRDFINPGIPAAVNPYTEFINCLFTNHEDQTGSAVVMEVFGDGVEGTLTNCTFANNNATLLGTDLLDAGGQINLRNNILSSGDSPVYVSGPAGNTGTVNSLGGNLVTDATLNAFLNSTDQSSTDPLFEAGTFQLSESSTAVDAGVLLNEPTLTDFAGNARLQGSCIDIGANESPYDAGVGECLVFTNTREVLDDPSTITIFPNPTSGLAHLAINNEWVGVLEIRIVNALGQIVHTAAFDKYDDEALVELDASDLPKGLYKVLISDGQRMAVGSFLRL